MIEKSVMVKTLIALIAFMQSMGCIEIGMGPAMALAALIVLPSPLCWWVAIPAILGTAVVVLVAALTS